MNYFVDIQKKLHYGIYQAMLNVIQTVPFNVTHKSWFLELCKNCKIALVVQEVWAQHPHDNDNEDGQTACRKSLFHIPGAMKREYQLKTDFYFITITKHNL